MRFSVALILIVFSYVWIVEPLTPRRFQHVPTVLVLGISLWRATRTGEWGVDASAFLPALRAAMIVAGCAALVIYPVGVMLSTVQQRSNPLGDLVFLLFWAAGQQFALQTVLLREAQAVSGRRRGIWLAALMFAAIHLPNPFLILMTFVGALAWCWIYDRHPNIVPLAVSHALVTLVILYSFDDSITGRLRVGYAYLLLKR
jgi:membrane protease YdiL (CAAX protease family)